MKKCRKYRSLIYREIDGIITDREKNALASHIEKCDDCREEYKLITEIKKELASEDERTLPDNFRQSLHKKLVEANLESSSRSSFSWRTFGNITATACVALAITLFAVNTVPELEKAKDIEITGIENKTVNQATTFSGEALTDNKAEETTADANLKMRSITPKTADKATAESDEVKENEEALQNEYSLSVASVLCDSLAPLTITVNNDADIEILIPYAEKNEDGTFCVPYEKLTETKEILKEFIISIENESSEEKYFTIKY